MGDEEFMIIDDPHGEEATPEQREAWAKWWAKVMAARKMISTPANASARAMREIGVEAPVCCGVKGCECKSWDDEAAEDR